MFVGIGFIALPITVLLYRRINASRDRALQEAKEKGIKYSPEEIRRLGDKAPDFTLPDQVRDASRYTHSQRSGMCLLGPSMVLLR